ncbi:MAG: site-specific DNA-methyltransferase [Spirochaetales bacterium]|jgi:DNA modification methylase|nr:site-specific DNA-methyltransferase [Spirochaetales bacterium]
MGHFNGFFENIPLDNNSIEQNLLNIDNKYKTNPLPWNGQFSPQLVQVLLNCYSKNADTIYDPFMGSGTTLLEAGELNRQTYGTDINYAAVCLSKIYELINYNLAYRILLVNEFENILIKCGILYAGPLFSEGDNIIIQIEKLVDKYSDSKYKILLDCFIILIDFYRKNFSEKWLAMKWFKIKDLIKSLPVSTQKISALQEDARETSFPDSLIDFVITSPPYINVFNYHQQYRSSSEYLNGNVLPSAQAEIGSNRKNRGNRFYTVIQYCIDMALVFAELNRICKDSSRIVFIVGRESSVRKTDFLNGEIVAEIACACSNMKLLNRQERVFVNRYGINIYEDILHFISSKIIKDPIPEAKDIAYKLLTSVLSSAPAESLDDLYNAIERVSDIQPSPFYKTASLVGV